jgi:hypothetical protein
LGGEPRLYTRGRGSVHVCEFANFKAPGTVHCRHQRHSPPHKPKSHVARLWKPERGFPISTTNTATGQRHVQIQPYRREHQPSCSSSYNKALL